MEPEQPTQQPDNQERHAQTASTVSKRPSTLILIAASAAILVVIGAGMLYLAYGSRSEAPVALVPSPAAGSAAGASPAAQAITPSPSPVPVSTFPPALAEVTFPTQSTAYPADWPAELHYPDQFSVVEAASGTLPDGVSQG